MSSTPQQERRFRYHLIWVLSYDEGGDDVDVRVCYLMMRGREDARDDARDSLDAMCFCKAVCLEVKCKDSARSGGKDLWV